MAFVKKDTINNKGYYADGLNYRFNAPSNYPKYYNDNTVPTHRATIIRPSGDTSTSMFGASVDAGEGVLVIGAPQSSSNSEKVYVYDLDGNEGYELTRTGTSQVNTSFTEFGMSVQVGYDRIFVAASDLFNGGVFYVYRLGETAPYAQAVWPQQYSHWTEDPVNDAANGSYDFSWNMGYIGGIWLTGTGIVATTWYGSANGEWFIGKWDLNGNFVTMWKAYTQYAPNTGPNSSTLYNSNDPAMGGNSGYYRDQYSSSFVAADNRVVFSFYDPSASGPQIGADGGGAVIRIWDEFGVHIKDITEAEVGAIIGASDVDLMGVALAIGEGRIIANYENGILVFDYNGNYITKINSGASAYSLGTANLPRQLHIGEGRIWANTRRSGQSNIADVTPSADLNAETTAGIDVFNLEGTYLTQLQSPPSAPAAGPAPFRQGMCTYDGIFISADPGDIPGTAFYEHEGMVVLYNTPQNLSLPNYKKHFSRKPRYKAPGITSSPDVISLSGTPQYANRQFGETSGSSILVGFELRTNGELRMVPQGGSTYVNAPGEWCNQSPTGGPYYVRARGYSVNTGGTLYTSGDSPSATYSDNLNQWLELNQTRTWIWDCAYQSFEFGALEVQISDDAAGNNILATGFYGVEVESGQ